MTCSFSNKERRAVNLSMISIIKLHLIHGNKHSKHPKKDRKARNLETRWKMTDDPMVKRYSFQKSYTILSMFYTKLIFTKNWWSAYFL